jgi:hypothetical protein
MMKDSGAPASPDGAGSSKTGFAQKLSQVARDLPMPAFRFCVDIVLAASRSVGTPAVFDLPGG